MPKSRVQLHVYDLSNGMAKAMSPMFLGRQIDYVPHSGIVVYGIEYFYGGGVQASKPEDVARAYGMQPAEILELGETEVDIGTFEDFLAGIKGKYTQMTYNLMRNNCNHFADECARFLLGNGIPDKIVKLPEIVLSSPMGAQLRPLLEQMDGQMNSVHGNINPFEMRRHGDAAGAGPAAGGAQTAAPTAHSAGAAAAGSDTPATSILPSKVLQSPARPTIRARIADVAPFMKAIRSHNSKAAAAGSDGGGAGTGTGSVGVAQAVLSEAELANADAAAQELQRRFAKPSDARSKPAAAAATDAAAAAAIDWSSFHTCMSRCLTTWPEGSHTSWLFLLRSSLATPEGSLFFSAHAARTGTLGKSASHDGSSAVGTEVEDEDGETKVEEGAETAAVSGKGGEGGSTPMEDGDSESNHDPGNLLVRVASSCSGGQYGALATQSVLGALANLLAHAPLAAAAIAAGVVTPATAAALAILTQGAAGAVEGEKAIAALKKAGAKPHVRVEAATYLRNLSLFLPVRDSGAAPDDLSDTAVELLFALLGEIDNESDSGVLRVRLEAAGRMLARTGKTGQVLAEELGLSVGPETIASDGSRPDDVRALAGEVARLFPADVD